LLKGFWAALGRPRAAQRDRFFIFFYFFPLDRRSEDIHCETCPRQYEDLKNGKNKLHKWPLPTSNKRITYITNRESDNPTALTLRTWSGRGPGGSDSAESQPKPSSSAVVPPCLPKLVNHLATSGAAARRAKLQALRALSRTCRAISALSSCRSIQFLHGLHLLLHAQRHAALAIALSVRPPQVQILERLLGVPGKLRKLLACRRIDQGA